MKEYENPMNEAHEDETDEVCTAGFDAVTEAFRNLYPDQTDPLHYGTLISWMLGGDDPLDGISVYDGEEFYHFVSYGLSELYEKESEEKDISGYGMELTLKLKKSSLTDEDSEIKCICGILQSLARVTFTKGEVFYPNEYIYSGQKEGMDALQKSKLTGFITISDPSLPAIETPNGRVQFVELIAVTDKEVRAVHEKKLTVEKLYEKLGTDVTDYGRDSVI